jgi:DNA-binding transcriptional ArsR family regulator
MSKETVKKVAPLSDTANEILDVLKASETPLTLAQIKEVVPSANSAHLTALRTRGLVEGEQVEIEVVKTTKAKVLQYVAKGE